MLLILRNDLCCFWGDLTNISSLGLISVTSVRLRPIVLRPRASFSKADPRLPEGVLGLVCSSGDAVLTAVVGRVLKPLIDTPESVLDLALLAYLNGSRSSRSWMLQHSLIILFTSCRYICNWRTMGAQPLLSPSAMPWLMTLDKTRGPFLSTAEIYLKKPSRCLLKLSSEILTLGGAEPKGGYKVLSIATQLCLLKGDRESSLIKICNVC